MLVPTSAEAADRYWVGAANGSDRWESAANWSTSRCGTGGASVPESADLAIFSCESSIARLRSPVHVAGLLMHTGSLLAGTGTLRLGSQGLRVGFSGTVLDMMGRDLRIAGSVTHTGGTIKQISHLALSGSLALEGPLGTLFLAATGTLILNGGATQSLTIGTYTNIQLGELVVRNTGPAGDNRVVANCDDFGDVICFFSAVTIERGVFDFDAHNAQAAIDGPLTIASGDLAQLLTDAPVFVVGDVLLGTSTSLVLSGSTVLLLSGNGTYTLDLAGATVPTLRTTLDEGTPTIVLRGNTRITGTFENATGATIVLNGFTLAATGATVSNLGTLIEGTGALVHAATALDVTSRDGTPTTTVSITGAAGQVHLALTDSDENIEGTGIDVVAVTVTLANGDTETVLLEETTSASGIFRGAVAIGIGVPQALNGSLQFDGSSTTLTVLYRDAQDGLERTVTARIEATNAGAVRAVGGSNVRGETRQRRISSLSPTHATGRTVPLARLYDDVPVDSWFDPYVRSLTLAGIVSGYQDENGQPTGRFGPAEPVTCAQIAKMVVLARGLSPHKVSPANPSARDHWSAGYVARIERLSISTFSSEVQVDQPCSRGRVVQTVMEVFRRPLPDATGQHFTDLPSEVPFAAAIEQAAREGLVHGDDHRTTFRPADPIARAEAAKIIDRAMTLYPTLNEPGESAPH